MRLLYYIKIAACINYFSYYLRLVFGGGFYSRKYGMDKFYVLMKLGPGIFLQYSQVSAILILKASINFIFAKEEGTQCFISPTDFAYVF